MADTKTRGIATTERAPAPDGATLSRERLIGLLNEDLAREVSRRLSPGIPADLGAGWFEGLAKRNRYALLARQPLWEELAAYVRSLDAEQFKRALDYPCGEHPTDNSDE